jgi:hypothetical protein
MSGSDLLNPDFPANVDGESTYHVGESFTLVGTRVTVVGVHSSHLATTTNRYTNLVGLILCTVINVALS